MIRLLHDHISKQSCLILVSDLKQSLEDVPLWCIDPHIRGFITDQGLILVITVDIRAVKSQHVTWNRAQVIDTAAGLQVIAVPPPSQQGATEQLGDKQPSSVYM